MANQLEEFSSAGSSKYRDLEGFKVQYSAMVSMSPSLEHIYQGYPLAIHFSEISSVMKVELVSYRFLVCLTARCSGRSQLAIYSHIVPSQVIGWAYHSDRLLTSILDSLSSNYERKLPLQTMGMFNITCYESWINIRSSRYPG